MDYLVNKKKILCNNTLKYNQCKYGTKCMYSHSLTEQNVDAIRKEAYHLITSSKINPDYIVSNELKEQLLVLTRICHNCIMNTCTGGYNCKYGAISNKYQVCYNDLLYGVCTNGECFANHLCKKGLTPLEKKNTYESYLQLENLEDGILLTDDNISEVSSIDFKDEETDSCCESIFS